MLGLDFCDFDNFLFLVLSLKCHEALSNLFPHLHELNLAIVALIHLNKPNYKKSHLSQSFKHKNQLKFHY